MLKVGCKDCAFVNAAVYLSNNVCDNVLNNEQCCFDGGDCLAKSLLWDCEPCNVQILSHINPGDGICDLKTISVQH